MLKYGTYASFEDAVPLPATFINFHIPGMLDDRILIANVISYIATHGRSSRIYSKLVEDKQIASTVGSYIDDREYSSLLTFYAITNNPEIELNSLKEEFLELIHQFNEKPVSETELNRAVNQLTLQVANQIQYSSGLADVISSEMLFTDDLNRIYNILERYKKITSEDVMEFANEFLDLNTEIIIDCLPAENK
jgi:predicted Zn-dependent peptidase